MNNNLTSAPSYTNIQLELYNLFCTQQLGQTDRPTNEPNNDVVKDI